MWLSMKVFPRRRALDNTFGIGGMGLMVPDFDLVKCGTDKMRNFLQPYLTFT